MERGRVGSGAREGGEWGEGGWGVERGRVGSKEFIIKMEGNTAEFSDISGSEIH